MIRCLILSVVVTALSVLTAEARLGVTLTECEERYGAVIERRPARLAESDPEACVFSKQGVSIIIEFRAGISWNIQYRAVDMISSQVTTLLKANMPEGGSWTEALIVGGVQYRLSGDRRRTASFFPSPVGRSSVLEVSSRDFNTAWWATYSKQMILTPGGEGVPTTGGLDGF